MIVERTVLNKKGGVFVDIIQFLLAFVVLMYVKNYIMSLDIIVGPSMEPTYKQGDMVVFNIIDKTYEVNDIVRFEGSGSHQGKNLIKRVAALPGDLVDVDRETGVVKVNNEVVVDEEKAHLNGNELLEFPFIMPEGYLFVLGDNQPNSADSRYMEVGLVPFSSVKGVAKAKIPLSILMGY